MCVYVCMCVRMKSRNSRNRHSDPIEIIEGHVRTHRDLNVELMSTCWKVSHSLSESTADSVRDGTQITLLNSHEKQWTK